MEEYFSGTDPNDPSDKHMPKVDTVEIEGNRHFSVSLIRKRKIEEVDFSIQFSPDLREWLDVVLVGDEVLPVDETRERIALHSLYPIEDDETGYWRVLFEEVPLKKTKADFLEKDTQNQGTWHEVYGSEGYLIPRHRTYFTSLVSFVMVEGDHSVQWAVSSEPRALQLATNPSIRIASALKTMGKIIFEMNFQDLRNHRLSLYFLDWEGLSLRQSVRIFDIEANEEISLQTIEEDFAQGVYLRWEVRGFIRVEIDSLSGMNTVLSGIFVDPV